MSNRNVKHSVRHVSKLAPSSWDRAIIDAEAMIQDWQKRVANLKRSVETFKYLRDSGQSFPGEKALLGQDSDL
jgi:hypothetical protein